MIMFDRMEAEAVASFFKPIYKDAGSCRKNAVKEFQAFKKGGNPNEPCFLWPDM